MKHATHNQMQNASVQNKRETGNHTEKNISGLIFMQIHEQTLL